MTHRLYVPVIVVAFASVFARPTVSLAQESARDPAEARNTADQAEARNTAGKALYKSENYAGAAHEFQQAIELVPDARYYFNLCATREKLGQYQRALDACDAVYQHNPDDRLKAKTGNRAANIRSGLREQGGSDGTGTGTDTGDETGTETGGDTHNVGLGPAGPTGPVATEVTAAVEPGLNYKWALGLNLGPITVSSLGNDITHNRGSAVKIYADFFVARSARLGLRVYGDFLTLNQGGPANGIPLNVFDAGVGIYWHQRLFGNFYVAPMAGLGGAFVYPNNDTSSYSMLNVRVETALQYVLGSSHVFSVVPLSLGLYSASQRSNANLFGLDTGAVTWSINFGYTYRFQKSFQQVVTLE